MKQILFQIKNNRRFKKKDLRKSLMFLVPQAGKHRFSVFSLKAFLLRLLDHWGLTAYTQYINGPDTLPPPLTKEEEKKVFDELGTNGEKAREMLIVHNLRLVVYIAKKFESTGIGMEDLVSIGTIGLIKAVNTFAPEKNIKLATYASRCIENEILMCLRKNSQLLSLIHI